MSFKAFGRTVSIMLTIVLLLCILTGISVASGNIFVNDASSTLDQPLASSYAIGSGGSVEPLDGGTLYAITANGIVELKDGTQTPPDPSTTDVVAAPLEGTVSIKNSTVKIGLQYRTSAYNTAVESATLTNVVGSGFRFGYYDSNRVFHEVGSTAETKISLVKDTNTVVDGAVIGCYHIRLPGTYQSFTQASTAAAGYKEGFPAYYNGTYYVLVGNYSSSSEADSARQLLGLQGDAFSASNRCVVVTKAGEDRVIFEYDGSTGSTLGVQPISQSAKGITALSTTGQRYYGGFEFLRYDGGLLSVINVVSIEDYVKGVVPYEMSSSWPIEALKTQAVAARSYVQYNYGKYAAYGFDILNGSADQVYKGTASATSASDQACDETQGQYLAYDGKLCCAFYFSSDGGATESSENVWSSPLGYCVGKADPFEEILTSGVQKWSKTFSAYELGAKLGIGTAVSVQTTLSPSGNMIGIAVSDANGNVKKYEKDSCRTFLSRLGFTYTSLHFSIAYDEGAGAYTISGAGWGHNVGMSQWGAYSMAENYGYNYREILGFYFTGIKIAQGV